MSIYKGSKILIIGGTGTIGQYLLKELLLLNPKVIRVFSRDEYKQFELQQDFSEYRNIRYLVGDIRDEIRLTRAMEDIDYVFHLAAMKHVPACEYNPFEAVKTNVIGTQNVIQAALANGVKRVLFTSTDKAIAPANTYGATKLTAERLISAAQYQKGPKKTIFSSVRFGNVMGSRGSVIPLFKKQILEHGRITVTDSSMLRYMMTPSQAIGLILKANELAKGGEVFVLKMPIVKLIDFAEVLIEEVASTHGIKKPIIIEEIGLRPGEKRFEELMTEDEAKIAYETDDMFILPPPFGANIDQYSSEWRLSEKYQLPQERDAISRTTIRKWLREEDLI
ncbi:polysaccharide biosynthesis protein [Alkalihalobacterium sp. APHAB7]|uniref:polysaccharide biosynthesis protein n=1 Tax=Alkalihalobacterium sp. APHAB7 TaxID=3402081 RepID=UPI003AAE4307